MCEYGATKCASLVRQNVQMWCGKMWLVWCVKVCGYDVKCRNGATECGNGATECGNGATEWRRNDDHERGEIDKIEFLYLRTFAILLQKLHFNCWH